jgi:hypothetical protein
MTTKEFLSDAVRDILNEEWLANPQNDEWVANPQISLNDCLEIIKESPTLDMVDDLIKSKGYKDIDEYNELVCEYHFDDGLYREEIYQSIPIFKQEIEDYVISITNENIPTKS